MILDANGQPAKIPEAIPTVPAQLTVSRQMKRAYLRLCAMAVINQEAGGEPRSTRRDMTRLRAKRPEFIESVRRASHAW